MMVLGHFALLRPWWLMGLPLALGLMFLARPSATGLGNWHRAIDPELMAVLRVRNGIAGGGATRLWAMFSTILLILLALSGPALQQANSGSLRNLDATLIVLDLSADATGNQSWQQAQTLAQRVLAEAGARQLGLILYAGDAYLAAPITNDAAATQALLFAVDAQTVPDPGDRPALALALARRILHEAGIVAGDVVLISSGGGIDAAATRQAAGLASDGHALHSLYVAPARLGATLEADRRIKMAGLAGAGRGFYGDVGRPDQVLGEISGRVLQHVAASKLGISGWMELGRWLLLVAAFPLLLVFRRAAA